MHPLREKRSILEQMTQSLKVLLLLLSITPIITVTRNAILMHCPYRQRSMPKKTDWEENVAERTKRRKSVTQCYVWLMYYVNHGR